MAGEFGARTVLSCTSRSKICEPAGEERRGDVDRARFGEAGRVEEWSVCEACVDGTVGCVMADIWDASWLEAGCEPVGVSAEEGVCFFLPSPKRLRFLDLAVDLSSWESASGVSRALGVEPSMLLSSATSSWAMRSPLVMGAASARRLMV